MIKYIIFIISIVLPLVSFIGSFVLMNQVKAKVPKGQQDQSPLSPQEKPWVIITSFFCPLLCQAVYYYGWKKKLPAKAKSANNWGWLCFLLGIISGFTIGIF